MNSESRQGSFVLVQFSPTAETEILGKVLLLEEDNEEKRCAGRSVFYSISSIIAKGLLMLNFISKMKGKLTHFKISFLPFCVSHAILLHNYSELNISALYGAIFSLFC